jgi:SAM-dependent methyltransferase
VSGGWEDGDYTAAGDAWAHAADDVVRAALTGLAGVPRVLDVGTGSGPAALAAARRGARVVGLDREPGLLRVAVERARRPAQPLGWVAGDARRLPFRAGAFDVVLSTFGVMFAPEPARVAAELVRVTRPGGRLAVASWTPDGIMGLIAPTVLRHLDGPPGPPAPTRWGEPDRVAAWFAPLPVTVRCRRARVRVRYPSVAHAVAVFETKPGPIRAHRRNLERAGRWDRARADLAGLFAAHNRADDGSLVFDAPYLLVEGRVRTDRAGNSAEHGR